MMEVYIRALEVPLTNIAGAKLVEHWNNQPANYDKEKQIVPAVYIDFGAVQWTNGGDGIKTAQATITFHCVNRNVREINSRANDADNSRLKRFEWSRVVLDALEGWSAKDTSGNYVIRSLRLLSSEMDTNHDALTDDVLVFNCTMLYYNTWRGLGIEAIIEAVDSRRVNSFS